VPLSITLDLAAPELEAAAADGSSLHLARWSGSGWQALSCTNSAGEAVLACESPRPGLFAMLMAPPIIGELDFDIVGGHFFKQANGFSGAGDLGFAVTDDDEARMWSEMVRLGGVERVGYPISQRFVYRGFLTQAFQRLVLQWRPELGRAVPVNVFDELNQRGRDDWLAATRQIPPAEDTTADEGLAWDQVVERHTALLDPYPELYGMYTSEPNAIEVFGLPLAVRDYGPVVVVRLQRASLQLWKTETAWAAAGSVVVGNGGDEAKAAGMWPAEATSPKSLESDI
jgi:hypothetical protein